jgi:hypothetical protein
VAETYNDRDFTGNADRQSKRGYVGAASAADVSGSQASAMVDLESLSLRSYARGGSVGIPSAHTQAWFKTEVWFVNVISSGATQPLQAFFHGTIQKLTGELTGVGSVYADMLLKIRDDDGNLITERRTEKSSRSSTPDADGTVRAAEPLTGSFDIPFGRSRYTVELGLFTTVRGYWEADFGSTVNHFIPPVEGITWEMPGDAGSRQYVPAWAPGSAPRCPARPSRPPSPSWARVGS